MKSQPRSNEKRMLRWGPIDGVWISLSYPSNILRVLWEQYRIHWPDGYIMSNGKQWMWIQTMDELEQKGWESFTQWVLVPEKRQLVRDNYENHIRLMHNYSDQIYHGEHTQWTNEQLLDWFSEWSKQFILFWAHASLPELVTWGAEAALRAEVEQLGDKKVSIEVMEALTAPTTLSFFQQAELDVFRRIATAQTTEDRTVALSDHLKEYYWIDNSYAQAHRRTSDDVEQLILHLVNESGDIRNAINTLETYAQRIAEKRKNVQQKYHLSETLMKWSRGLGDAISWQDERKGEQLRQHDVLFTLVRECEKRFGIPYKDAVWLNYHELIEHCTNKQSLSTVIECRKKGMVVHISKKSNREWCGSEALPLLEQYWERSVTEEPLQGQVASFGKQQESQITGNVCIVFTPQQAEHFHMGDILVARMTSPDYMPIMRKASAVVTDEGGLTAHAAVVARELGIPCIVGTKFATKVLNNGDQVTLDIQTGSIKKEEEK